MQKKTPSRLSALQQRTLLVVVALGVFMVADTLYLLANRLADVLDLGYFAVTDISLPKFYQGMVLSHTGIGLVLVALVLGFVVWHLPAVWRKSRKRAIYTGIVTVVLGLVLAVSGLFILSASSNRGNGLAYWGHVGAAALVPLFYLLHRRISLWKPSALSYRAVPGAIAALLGLAVVLHGLTYSGEQYTQAAEEAFAAGKQTGPGSRERNVADYALGGFVPANFVPVQSPFFPAATTTTTGDFLPSRIITRGDLSQPEKLAGDLAEYGFVVNEPIGSQTCARCHQAVVEQWSKSAHRFASFNNPFYEASINDMRLNATEGNPEIDAGRQDEWRDRSHHAAGPGGADLSGLPRHRQDPRPDRQRQLQYRRRAGGSLPLRHVEGRHWTFPARHGAEGAADRAQEADAETLLSHLRILRDLPQS
jgi:hypothetical protein